MTGKWDAHYVHHEESKGDAAPANGSLICTFADCPARHLTTFHADYAEVDQQAYLCDLMSFVDPPHTRGSAFCVNNLNNGCCPRGYAR